jgi:hypothetical protein
MIVGDFSSPTYRNFFDELLATLRDRVELKLQDSGNTIWAADDLDEAIEEALEQYSQRSPAQAVATLTLAAAGREVDISTLTDIVRIEKVWWPYDSTNPTYPPNWCQFEVWPGDVLFIDEPTAPTSGQKVRIFYNEMHTLNGLNGATATTIPEEDIAYIIAGAAHFAAQMRAVELAETLTVDRDVGKRLLEYAEEQGKNFRYGIAQRPPAYQRYAYAYDQNDIDEAIAWALDRYNEVNPEVTITTVTLAASGREVDISSITDYLDIIRVWWDYDSTDSEYPPNWRNFELWPGDLLFIDSDDEPASGDKVRIWYTRARTINGLAGAASTTVPDDQEILIVNGAAGFAAEERVQENPSRWVPRKLREWADARLRDFERGLKALAQRNAARHSGIASMAPLDRWDKQDNGW